MNVLVVGGTGFVGTRLCAELVDRGHEVAALSRTPGDADLEDEVERIAGDVTAYASVVGAFEGRDAVYFLPALSALFEPPPGRSHDAVHRRGTETALRAAREHDVGRYVQLSGIFPHPEPRTDYGRAKARAEALVAESGLEWTIVRPGIVFGDGDEFGAFLKYVTTPWVAPLPGGGEARYQPIWVGDLASMLADCLEDEAHVGRTYALVGPERLTLRECVELLYAAEGRTVRTVPVPTRFVKLVLSFLEYVPRAPMGADQAKSVGLDLVVGDDDADAFGVDPAAMVTYAEYLGVN